MNSWRDKVKDALDEYLEKLARSGDVVRPAVEEMKYNIADIVFDALGITEDEQDTTDGCFIHHAGQQADMEDNAISFTKLSLPQKMAATELAVEITYTPYEKAHLVRKMFLDMFRAADGVLDEALSADDCYEIFLSILKGSSDLTYKTLFALVCNYDGGHEDFCLVPMNDEIKNAASVKEAMHYVMKEIMKDASDGN